MFSQFFKAQRPLTNKLSRQTTRTRLQLESLEDRVTPTVTSMGFFDAASTMLVINCDAGDDNLLITEGAVPGTFTIVGGGINQTFTGLTDIFINLGTGANQSVTFNGSLGGSLSGMLGVSDGSTATFTLTIGDNANVNGGLVFAEAGNAAVTVNLGAAGGGTTFVGNVALYGGTGAATTNIDDVTMGFLSANYNAATAQTINIGANAPVSMGFLSVLNSSAANGSNVVVAIGAGGNVTIGGNMAVSAGLNATLTMASTGVQGYVGFLAGSATAAVNVTIANTTIASYLAIQTGGAGETLNIPNTAGATVNVGQNVAIVTQGGGDTLNLYGLQVTGTTFIDTGAGGDTVDLDFNDNDGVVTTFNGPASIQLGADNDAIFYAFASGDLNDAAIFVNGGVVNGNAGTDTSNFKTTSDAVSPVPVTESNFETINS